MGRDKKALSRRRWFWPSSATCLFLLAALATPAPAHAEAFNWILFCDQRDDVPIAWPQFSEGTRGFGRAYKIRVQLNEAPGDYSLTFVSEGNVPFMVNYGERQETARGWPDWFTVVTKNSVAATNERVNRSTGQRQTVNYHHSILWRKTSNRAQQLLIYVIPQVRGPAFRLRAYAQSRCGPPPSPSPVERKAVAARVAAYSVGNWGTSVSPGQRYSANALGQPDGRTVSLGCGGELIVGFGGTGVSIGTVGIEIVEVGIEAEPVEVFVTGPTFGGWQSIGIASGGRQILHFPSGTRRLVNQVKLRDMNVGNKGNCDSGTAGADIDSVSLIQKP